MEHKFLQLDAFNACEAKQQIEGTTFSATSTCVKQVAAEVHSHRAIYVAKTVGRLNRIHTKRITPGRNWL